MRHLNNGTDHRHSKSCCDQSSPARRTIKNLDRLTISAPQQQHQLDESTARRQLKSPRSLSGRSIHLTLVTKWSWSRMTYCHPLCAIIVNRPSHSEIQLFQNLTKTIHGQGHACGQRSRSHLTLKIHRSRLWSRSDPLVTFDAWSSIDMFAFRSVAIGPFLAEI